MTDHADKSAEPDPAETSSPGPAEADKDAGQQSRGTSWRAVGIIVSAAALVCVGAGVFVGIHVASTRQSYPEALQKRFRQAEQHYRQGRFAEAVAACRELRDFAPQTPHARKARVLLRFAETRLALEGGEVKAARRKLAAADELLDELAEADELRGWVRAVRADYELHPRIATEWAESRRVLTGAKQLLAQGQPRAAMHFLARELPAARLSIPQQDELRDLRAGIYGALFTDAVRRGIRTGSHLTGLGRFDKADWAFAEAQTNLQEADQMGYLAADAHRALQAALTAGIEKLADARDYQAATEQIRLARDQGKLAAERDALQRALRTAEKVRPAQAAGLKQRLRAVELEMAFADALARAEQATSDEAVAVLAEFAAAHPEHTEAASALEAMKADRKRGQRIAEGDAAMRAGKWAEARAKYEAAGQIKTDAVLEDRLAHAAYEMTMQTAREARREKRYDAALAAVDRAARLYPPAAEQAEAWRDRTLQEQKYVSDLGEAKAALAAGKRKQARQILENMQPQTKEVLTLRDRAAYQEQRQLAIDAMRRRDYEAAYEHLKTAKEHAQPGEEIRQIIELMGRVEPLLKPPAPQPPRAVEPRLGLIRAPLYRPFGYGMHSVYSNGYFPYVAFGYHDQIYLGGTYYPVFYSRGRRDRRATHGPRRRPQPQPVLRAGRPSKN